MSKAIITPKERDFIRHALGLTRGSVAYRNFYSAGGDDVRIGRDLVSRGLAVVREPNAISPDPLFYITEEGFEAASGPRDTLDDDTARFMRVVTLNSKAQREAA